MPSGCQRSAQRGTSLLELTLARSVAAVLTATAAFSFDGGGTELTVAHQEIVGSLHQAFALARARRFSISTPNAKAIEK